jgi:tripartite-type tricarboxylate transporter receptor subunit TctC
MLADFGCFPGNWLQNSGSPRKDHQKGGNRAMASVIRMIVLLALGWAATAPAPVLAAAADAYPTRPVMMIVPYPAGGATDIIGRVLAEKLSERLGQQVVVDNRAGAEGNLGAATAARADPDGYTLLMGALTSHSINATLQQATANFDLEKDFAPISIVGSVPLVLVVHPSVPAQSAQQLIALAKEKPGDLMFASAGNGSPQHLAGELLKLQTGTEMVHVPYKGSGPAMTDIIGGHVPVMIETAPASVSHIKSDKLRALMVTAKERLETLPDVPTAAEAGLPGFEVSSMFGVLAPKDTPQPIVDRLNGELTQILELPDVQEKLRQQGVAPTHTTPGEAAEGIHAEVEKWAKVIREANVKAD